MKEQAFGGTLSDILMLLKDLSAPDGLESAEHVRGTSEALLFELFKLAFDILLTLNDRYKHL